ncbi:hypothetical protein Dsin_012707 [Dipteronia sinensis]|uniref:Uncharacterized protein n=1 Tax=Dipteronia sinensis TaxID=43782 RepID=A0AAE0E8Q6_9ROSI|nr:hypothetical protein Dsin_012707 [Dipteronia sinensis]
MNKRKTDEVDPKGKAIEVESKRPDPNLVLFPHRVLAFKEPTSFIEKACDVLFSTDEGLEGAIIGEEEAYGLSRQEREVTEGQLVSQEGSRQAREGQEISRREGLERVSLLIGPDSPVMPSAAFTFSYTSFVEDLTAFTVVGDSSHLNLLPRLRGSINLLLLTLWVLSVDNLFVWA